MNAWSGKPGAVGRADARLSIAEMAKPASLICLALAAWFITRPFTFSENDGQLYAFMAMAWADPQRFGDDLFIRYGSQDAFSVFSPIYGTLIRVLGLATASRVMLASSAALWVIGSWLCLRRIAPARFVPVALIALCSVRLGYGGYSALMVGEGQPTARILAEALVLLGVAQWLSGRWVLCGAALLCALALHPLMALCGVAVLAMAEAMARPKLAFLVGGGAVLGLGLAWLGVHPFDRLFQTIDPSWRTQIERHNGFVYIGNWTANDWAVNIGHAVIVLVGAVRAEGAPRRLLIGSVAVAVLCLIVSYVGGDLLGSALIVQLQLWRATWLPAWLSVPAVALMASGSREVRSGVALCAATLLISNVAALPAAVIGALFVLFPRSFPGRVHRLVFAAAIALTAAVLAVGLGAWTLHAYALRHSGVDATGLRGPTAESFGLIVAAALAVAAAAGERRPLLVGGISLIALALAWSQWDQRDDRTRAAMDGRLAGLFGAGPVLWGSKDIDAWFLLRATDYLSLQQASGLLFSRQTALAWGRRADLAHGLVSQKPWSPANRPDDCGTDEVQITRAQFAALCQDAGATLTLVSPVAIPALGLAKTVRAPAPEFGECLIHDKPKLIRRQTYYAYQCPAAAATP